MTTNLTIRRKPYFYDAQVKRYLLQIMGLFGGFTIHTGKGRNGTYSVLDVPVIYGGYSRAVQYILNGGNSNTVNALPVLSIDLTRLQQSDTFRRAPQHVEKLWYYERAQTSTEGEYGTGQGDQKIMERYMPVPYDMGINVSLWASNNDSGYQVLEQVMTYFNPELDIQLSNSPGDWTFISHLKFDGNVEPQRVSSGIGGGSGDDAYYVWSMDFSIEPIHISPPAKVYDAQSIESVHANILELNDPVDFDTMTPLDSFVITGS